MNYSTDLKPLSYSLSFENIFVNQFIRQGYNLTNSLMFIRLQWKLYHVMDIPAHIFYIAVKVSRDFNLSAPANFLPKFQVFVVDKS